MLVLLGVFVLAGHLGAQSVSVQSFATGLDQPVHITNAGDDRVFVVERPGRIRIVRPDGSVDATPFLNITDRVNCCSGEQGLLGLAFHPQYANNGYFYVHYSAGTGNGVARISRFTVSSDPDVALATTETVIYSLPQTNNVHQGGDLAFGPDGYLWIPFGDGGTPGDSENRAQNMTLAYGKVLRIDVDGGTPYSIPPDNPFAGANPNVTLREIWASGLRNPYRFSFDGSTGDVWIADVGQANYEEVNRIPAGQHTGVNFGWRCYEGNQPYNTSGCAAPSNYEFPIQVNWHQVGGHCAVVGGHVYRGSQYPNLYGRYIYTDFCHGRILSLRANGNGGWIHEDLTASGPVGYTDIGPDANGELYVANMYTGTVSRITDASAVVRVNPQLWLEGPFDAGTSLMSDALRVAGLIPLTEPYTQLGFPAVAGGGESTTSGVLSVTGNTAIVDWVRVELRSAANPANVVVARHALLRRNGVVVKPDGTGGIEFNVGAGQYYVAVRHRNHLGVMTAAPITLGATTTIVNFRSSATATYGTDARKVSGTQRLLWAGNVVPDGMLSYVGLDNDRDPILLAIGGSVFTATVAGYLQADVNMDGVAKYAGSDNDRDPILGNVGGTVPTNTRSEQVP